MKLIHDKALIIFSRLPIGNETKTRLSPLLTEKEREDLHVSLWKDIFNSVDEINDTIDIFLYWTGNGDIKNYKSLIPNSFKLCKQHGENLGKRMLNAINELFFNGYKQIVIIGADIPTVSADDIKNAFNALENFDVVLGPSLDGGYWLIGMKNVIPEIFYINTWGNKNVLNATLKVMNEIGISYSIINKLLDIDTPEDIEIFMNNSSERGYFTRKFLYHILQKRRI